MYFQIALFVCLIPLSTSSKYECEAIMATIVTGCNEFAHDLHTKLQKPGDNVIFSPYSICTALNMLLLGAKGNTAEEFSKTFHYLCNEDIGPAIKVLFDTLNKDNLNFTLKTANRLFGDKTIDVKEDYQKNLETFFNASLQQVDFQSGTAEAVINDWVSKNTNDKIKEVFPKGSLDSLTKLVLASATYFKADWLAPFKKDLTTKEIFTVSPGKTVMVDMMNKNADFLYSAPANLNAKILELPYAGKRFSMLIILPSPGFELSTILQNLKGKEYREASRTVSVDVKLPKFKIETEYNLNEALKKLQLKEIFSANADLSGISSTALKVSEVKHKVVIEVDEEGTEAAAATSIGIQVVSLQIPIDFHVNRPFLFAIIDKTNGLILFQGAITDPTKVK